jgi:hypothetical protein
MQLKDLLIQIFQESELGDHKIELQELPTGTVFGTITSQTFSGKSSAHNIKVIWDILEKSIPEDKRKMIKEIVPITSEQQDVIDKFERDEPPQGM